MLFRQCSGPFRGPLTSPLFKSVRGLSATTVTGSCHRSSPPTPVLARAPPSPGLRSSEWGPHRCHPSTPSAECSRSKLPFRGPVASPAFTTVAGSCHRSSPPLHSSLREQPIEKPCPPHSSLRGRPVNSRLLCSEAGPLLLATCGWFLRCSFARGGGGRATALRRHSRGRDESRPWSRHRAFAPCGRSGRNGRVPSSRSW